MTKLWRYRVDYRRRNTPLRREFHAVVAATDADDARAQVAKLDPLFLRDQKGNPTTVRTPRRMGTAEPPDSIDVAKWEADRMTVTHEWHGHTIETEVAE
jgi:hypothetical protein